MRVVIFFKGGKTLHWVVRGVFHGDQEFFLYQNSRDLHEKPRELRSQGF